MKVNVKEIRERCEKVFVAAGVSASDAKIISDVLLQTDMRGVYTHGFYRIPNYIKCLRSGGVSAKSELNILCDTPSWACVDGEGGLGIIISYKAMQLAMKKAKETGVGIVNVKGSHHFGAAGYYTGMCADNKMIGMSMSNGDILVAATGSREKTIGNNPFSFAAPAGKFDKVVYDIAMSYSSDRKIVAMAKEGKLLPEGWLIDKAGRNTVDPNEYEKGGTLLPFGGYKGYGLAMMVEILGACMSGAAMTKNVHAWNTNTEENGNVGHFFMALDIERMMEITTFEERMETMISEIKGSEKAEGVDTIFYPGEIELGRLAKCEAEGMVEIADSTVEAFEEVEKSFGLS